MATPSEEEGPGASTDHMGRRLSAAVVRSLVDLIVSGWQGVDERLARVERALGADEGAIVYRIEDRRSGT